MIKLQYRKRKLLLIIVSILACLTINLIYKVNQNSKYDKAIELYSSGEYGEALKLFDDLGFYEESFDYSVKSSIYIEYEKAKKYLGIGTESIAEDIDYEEAAHIFASLGDFENSKDYWEIATFKYARQLYDNGQYDEAAELFLNIIDYVDEDSGEDAETFYAKSRIATVGDISETVYNSALKEYNEKDYINALKDFTNLNGYKDSLDWIDKCRVSLTRKSLEHTISAGVRYSLAIENGGEIKVTGDISLRNKKFLLNLNNKEDIKAVSGFASIVAVLRENGHVEASADYNLDIDSVNSWSNIIAISTGEQYIVGLDSDGKIFGAGHPNDGQIDFEGWENIIAFDTSWRRTVGVDTDGVIHITGYGSKRHINEISEANYDAENTNDENIKKRAWNNIAFVATGGGYGDEYGHTVGLKFDGTVVAVGDNDHKQCDVFGWENVIAIAAGDYHTVGLTSDGRVVYAGDSGSKYVDESGYVKEWNDIIAIAAGRDYTLALTSSGEVLSFGDDKQNQRPQSKEWNDIVIYDCEGLKKVFDSLK